MWRLSLPHQRSIPHLLMFEHQSAIGERIGSSQLVDFASSRPGLVAGVVVAVIGAQPAFELIQL